VSCDSLQTVAAGKDASSDMNALAETLAPYRVAIAFTLPTALIAAVTTVTSHRNIVFYPFLFGVILVSVSITVVIAVPVFLFMRHKGWLQWGHALLAGMLAGALVTLLLGGNKADQVIAVGGAFGLLVWWVGVFRNPNFPGVSGRMPWSMGMVVPLAALWAWYRL
jgi:hypothetical protein